MRNQLFPSKKKVAQLSVAIGSPVINNVWDAIAHARTERDLTNFDREYDVCVNACESFPDEPVSFSSVIEWLYDKRRFHEAEIKAQETIARFPNDYWTIFWAAKVSDALEHYQKSYTRWKLLSSLHGGERDGNLGAMRALLCADRLDLLKQMLDGSDVHFDAAAVPDVYFRTPADLRVEPTHLERVLLIGSCLTEGLPYVFSVFEPKCSCDFILVNNLSSLPDTPPRPVSDYDFQILQIPLRSILPDGAHFSLEFDNPEGYRALFEDCCSRISRSIDLYMKWNAEYALLTFVFNFTTPQQNPMGRLLPRYDLRNFVYFIERLNEYVAEEVSRFKNAYLLDVDQIVATYGRRYVQDDTTQVTGHAAFINDADHANDLDRLDPLLKVTTYYPSKASEICQVLWREIEAMYRSICQIDSVKLVLLDLDDTLWRGVLAETGTTNLEGWPIGLAETLLFLKRRGIILGIVSKNSEERILELWSQVFGPTLPLNTFAARKINWRSKVENITEILSEVNLLPKSVVFIDDNPVERSAVNETFPDMRVLGANPYLLRRILLWSAETQVVSVTEESAKRGDMVRAQVEREQLRRVVSREQFLASLDVHVAVAEIASVDSPSFPRALELLNKTNQFNTTGGRWTTAEALAYFERGGSFMTLTVADKFTAYGVVGVVCSAGDRIDQFVMSCRVFGLDVELAMVSEVLRRLAERGARAVTAEIVATAANLPSRDIWCRCGFREVGEASYEFIVADVPVVPQHITVLGEGG